jgi:hypothetical protein
MDGEQIPLNSTQETQSLQKEVERLTAENLLLRQRTELEHLWREDRERQSAAFDQHKTKVETEINKRLVGLSVVGLVVVGFGWWSVSRPIRQSVQERLDREFASDNIRSLISAAALRAAQSQTSEMMESTLKPAVSEAMKQIQQQNDAVKTFTEQFRQRSERDMGQIKGEVDQERKDERKSLDELRTEYTKQINDLGPLVRFQEKLKEIDLLKNRAIDGEFGAYSQLIGYKSEDKDLTTASQTAIIEVKEPYLVGKRTTGVSIWLVNSDGSHGLTDESIPTAMLISTFLLNNSQQWLFRARAAELLASKREQGVAEALLRATQSDSNLWVRRAALQSFQSLTGYQPPDVLGFDGAAEWWEKNNDSYKSSIPK